MTQLPPIQVHTVYAADEEVKQPSHRLRLLGLTTLLVAVAWLLVVFHNPFHNRERCRGIVPDRLIAFNSLYAWVPRTLAFAEIEAYSKATGADADGEKGGGADLGAIMGILGSAPPPPAAAGKSPPPSVGFAPISDDQRRELLRATSYRTAFGYGWLIMMAGVGLWLVAGGAAGVSSGGSFRRSAAVVFPLTLVAAGTLAGYLWREYGWYETAMPPWAKPAMAGLLLVAAAVFGAALNRYALRLLRVAGVLTIVSAAVSVVCIWLPIRWGFMPDIGATITLYAKTFGIQSAYGWLLLLATVRIR
jgi:hypothetical protein